MKEFQTKNLEQCQRALQALLLVVIEDFFQRKHVLYGVLSGRRLKGGRGPVYRTGRQCLNERGYEEYMLTYMMYEMIPDFKLYQKNKYKYGIILAVASDYCNANGWSSVEWNTNSKTFEKTKNAKKVESFKNSNKIIECLKKKIVISSIDDVCSIIVKPNGTEICNTLTEVHEIETPFHQRSDTKEYWPLPNVEETNKYFDALKECIDTQPYIAAPTYATIYIDTAFDKLIQPSYDRHNNHRLMCLSDDPNKISKHFECFNYKYDVDKPRPFHGNFMDCARLLDIDRIKKQEVSCNHWYILPDLEDVKDIDIKSKLFTCLSSKNSSSCLETDNRYNRGIPTHS